MNSQQFSSLAIALEELDRLRAENANLHEQLADLRAAAGQAVEEVHALSERVRELEDAQEWEPAIGHICSSEVSDTELIVDGNYLVVNPGRLDNISIRLPADVRLMRRRPQEPG